MTVAHWAVIGILALAAFLIRVLGLAAGERVKASRYSWVVDELPGLIVICLVAASLADQTIQTWITASAAFVIAVLTDHVVATMILGVAIYAGLSAIWT